MRRALTATLFLSALVTTTALTQGPQPTGFAVDNPVLRRIWALESDSSQLPQLAQVLFASLGPRLTASPGMNAAQSWLLATYTAWGIPARKEQYGTWRSWRRGKTHIDLVAPRARTLEGTALAWSPTTPRGKPVRGSVVIIPDVADSAALVAWPPQAVAGKANRQTSAMRSILGKRRPPPVCPPERGKNTTLIESLRL